MRIQILSQCLNHSHCKTWIESALDAAWNQDTANELTRSLNVILISTEYELHIISRCRLFWDPVAVKKLSFAEKLSFSRKELRDAHSMRNSCISEWRVSIHFQNEPMKIGGSLTCKFFHARLKSMDKVLNNRQLDRLSEILGNMSLLFLGSLVIPAFSGQTINSNPMTLTGASLFIGFLMASLLILKGGDPWFWLLIRYKLFIW